MKECGTESAKVLEGAMREAGEETAAKGEEKEGLTRSRGGAEGEKALTNERARGETTEGTNSGSFAPEGGGGDSGKGARTYTPATREAVEKFQKELPKEIAPEEFDSLLTAGFMDTDGAGNAVKYGTLLRDHIDEGGRNPQDRDARKKRLGVAVAMVRQSTPLPTGTEGKAAERVYAGIVDGNAYIAIADEHNEIDALEMVSYRRGSHKEVRKT